jgi:hypothetical protein
MPYVNFAIPRIERPMDPQIPSAPTLVQRSMNEFVLGVLRGFGKSLLGSLA